MYLRFFWSSIDPADVSELRRVFLEDVKPVFSSLPGCASIELAVCAEASAGGLLEGAVVSQWRSLPELTEALGSRAVAESMVRVVPLLRLEPVVQTLEIVG